MPFKIESSELLTGVFLMVCGPDKWYRNLLAHLKSYGRTWMQQNKVLDNDFVKDADDGILKGGFLEVYGYITHPISQVLYKFDVDKIISAQKRIYPPDETAPPFSDYDIQMGKCKNANDYMYVTWLRIKQCHKLEPLELNEFINVNNSRPIRSFSGQAHYYVLISGSVLSKMKVKK